MNEERQKLLREYFQQHQQRLSLKILKIALIYLSLSIIWNLIFYWLDLQYSRANISYLAGSLLLLLGAMIWNRLKPITTAAMLHVVLCFVLIVVCSLYFGSGYHEAWAFFLTIPLLTGLYGKRKIMLGYIGLGLGIMLWLSIRYPLTSNIVDFIDISNRTLLYIIIATFSFILVEQLIQLYNNQVNTIIESTDNTIEQVVKSFIISIEAKDAYTFGHSERVSRYALALARLLPEFQNEQRLKRLSLAGLLHDIGKINIPESVLTKPSTLTEEEYELIKTHPVVGSKMVEKIHSLSALKPGILYHHERWDGRGYPAGLYGEEIPLESRILAIADAFDAMTSSRAYRQALTFQEAFKNLYLGGGNHFDPHLINHLEAIQISWRVIYNEYNTGFDEFERMTNLL
ncbi:HD-GYP domain-containing protein [Paenibacillus sp. sgz302251]|uniref:HD-GYP domain-containing protein n=1 Tax=Paenibacillus sp. sgz302251 TaxID=3414493 RepID=UPI003C7A8793